MVRIILVISILMLSNFITAQHNTKIFLNGLNEKNLTSKIERNVSALLSQFNKSFKDSSGLDFKNISIDENAKARIISLWQTARFMCSETELYEFINKREDTFFEIRNIPLVIKTTNDSLSYEDAVVLLSPEGIIMDLYFGIEIHQYKKLLRQNSSVTDFRRRQIILDFVENFRTAYNRKDLNFLEKIFSDNALIIVGRVIQEKQDDLNLLESNFEKKKVELIRYNKAQYISQLQEVFKTNSFIKILFDDIDLTQHRLHNTIYGVTLKQHWRSSSYSDKGYLFLMIDFKDEEHPLIHVRAWQPEAFTNPDSVISLGDFEIIK